AGLLPAREVAELTDAWTLAWQIRRCLFLWKGREGDVLPSDRHDLRALALLIDGDDGSASDLEERYLRATRRARSIAEEMICGPEAGGGPCRDVIRGPRTARPGGVPPLSSASRRTVFVDRPTTPATVRTHDHALPQRRHPARPHVPPRTRRSADVPL